MDFQLNNEQLLLIKTTRDLLSCNYDLRAATKLSIPSLVGAVMSGISSPEVGIPRLGLLPILGRPDRNHGYAH